MSQKNIFYSCPCFSLPFQIPLLPCLIAPHQCKYPFIISLRRLPLTFPSLNSGMVKMPALSVFKFTLPQLSSICCCSLGSYTVCMSPAPLHPLNLILPPFLSHHSVLTMFLLFLPPSFPLNPVSPVISSQEEIECRQSRQYVKEKPSSSQCPLFHHLLHRHHQVLVLLLAHRLLLCFRKNPAVEKKSTCVCQWPPSIFSRTFSDRVDLSRP